MGRRWIRLSELTFVSKTNLFVICDFEVRAEHPGAKHPRFATSAGQHCFGWIYDAARDTNRWGGIAVRSRHRE